MREQRELPECLIEPPALSLERGFGALLERRHQRRERALRRQRLWSATALVACVGLAVLQLQLNREPTAQAAKQPALPSLAAGQSSQTTALDDGSVLMLAPRAQLTTVSMSPRRVAMRLEQGEVTFDLEPKLDKRWDIDATLAQVQATDARFAVERNDSGVRVQVLRGTVLVYAAQLAEGHVEIREGKTLQLSARRDRDPPPAVVAEPVPAVVSQVAEQSASLTNRGSAPPAVSLRASAPAPQQLSAEALWARADEARDARRLEEAILLLAQFERSYPADRRVGMAAFTLGRLTLDRDARAAATWFHTALARGVPAMLAEDAAARLVQALSQAGDADAARDARALYLAQYPAGRYVRDVQAWAP